jgi:hypothetical protein
MFRAADAKRYFSPFRLLSCMHVIQPRTQWIVNPIFHASFSFVGCHSFFVFFVGRYGHCSTCSPPILYLLLQTLLNFYLLRYSTTISEIVALPRKYCLLVFAATSVSFAFRRSTSSNTLGSHLLSFMYLVFSEVKIYY